MKNSLLFLGLCAFLLASARLLVAQAATDDDNPATSGALTIVSTRCDMTKATVTIRNEGDSTETFHWRDLRGIRRDGSALEPQDCQPINGDKWMQVPPHETQTYLVVFGAYQYGSGNWLTAIVWAR